MKAVTDYTKEELLNYKVKINRQYEEYVKRELALDMTRGKPSAAQLDLSNPMLTTLDTYYTNDGIDARNYGILDGIPEVKQIFSDLLDIPASQIIIGGNASLKMMYDQLSRLYMFGTQGFTPWGKLDKVTFLCPSPGYDRHFAITEKLGFQMLSVPMTDEGPDMDVVEAYVKEDESIKGIWCVPLYSNPEGICYSDRTVKRLASMKTKARDFRIFWDNAYGVHHLYEETPLLNILKECEKAGNADRTYYFFSTSKISFAGSGISIIASSAHNAAEIKKSLSVETIGYDKLNQLRHLQYFKNAEGIRQHMKKMADLLRPRLELVLEELNKELKGIGLASWQKPKGGYFVSVDTLFGCAKRTVSLAAKAGVKLTEAGATYPYKNDPQDQNIRLTFSYPALEELKLAMQIFCICVKLAGVERLLEEPFDNK